MFSRKKIAAVSVLLGGLAVAGIPQAYAEGAPLSCTRDLTGNVSCVQKNADHTSQDGKYTLKQAQDCLSSTPVTMPSNGLLNTGSTRIGPAMTCSNTAPEDGESMPQIGG
ncbi:hypothetical protein ACGFOU_03275 [Streptomyces sp. NPDC048595]|uniref:hypothetical protein n=1 Tax=Streptomyces sp. NPDC048595 TaxID=3365576 RepID=UPI00371D03DF